MPAVCGLGDAVEDVDIEVLDPRAAVAVDVRQQDRLRPAL